MPDSLPSPTRRRAGVTLLEILLTMAVLSVLSGIGFTSLRSPDASLYARHASEVLGEARFHAVARTADVVSYWDADAGALVLRESDGSCATDGPLVARALVSDFPRATVDAAAFTPVLWRPNGLPSFCGATPAATRLVVRDGRTERTVQLDLVGEVTVR